jgi:hypothetical protein
MVRRVLVKLQHRSAILVRLCDSDENIHKGNKTCKLKHIHAQVVSKHEIVELAILVHLSMLIELVY